MPYFYTDANGQRQGPINDQTLRALVTQGIILRTTPMETEGGHRGLAGQIPGIPWPDPPTLLQEQLHCTNCGTVVSGQADSRKCLSCGFKSTGHRKFCRSCGTGISPKQEICVRCGTAVPSTWTILTENLGNFFSVGTSSSLVIAKFAVGWGLVLGIIAALWWFVLPIVCPPKNPAKPGDWVRYDVTFEPTDGPMARHQLAVPIVFEVEATGNSNVRLNLSSTHPLFGKGPIMNIDSSKPRGQFFLALLTDGFPGGEKASFKIERGKTEKEQLLAGDKSFDCIRTPFTITATGMGEGTHATMKGTAWHSKTLPFFGLVKMEWERAIFRKEGTEKHKCTMTFSASSSVR